MMPLVLLMLLAYPPDEPPAVEVVPDAEGFYPLITDDSLAGWLYGDWANLSVPPKQSGTSWKMEDGELVGLGKRSWIFSENEYSDYVLKFDWKISPGANCGVGLRLPPDGDPAVAGMEIQLVDEKKVYPSGCRPEQRTGAIYDEVAPSKASALPPGEWNACTITCDGDTIQVVLNEEEIVACNLAEMTESKQAGRAPLAERPRQGSIGFQNQAGRLWVRNARIKVNEEKTQAEK